MLFECCIFDAFICYQQGSGLLKPTFRPGDMAPIVAPYWSMQVALQCSATMLVLIISKVPKHASASFSRSPHFKEIILNILFCKNNKN